MSAFTTIGVWLERLLKTVALLLVTVHFIHLDDPEAAVQAIRDVVRAARDGAPVARASATH